MSRPRKTALALLLVAGCATSRTTTSVGTRQIVTLRADYANVYLLPTSDGKVVLIDSGFPKNVEKLEAQIKEAGYQPSQVTALIVTHGHYDHAGAARHFQEHYGTRIVAGRGDEAMMASGRHEPICPTGFLARQRYADDSKGTFPPLKADVWIDAPTPLSSVAAIEGQILPMPGHTGGSLVILVGEATFVGDMFRGSIAGSGAEVHFYMCDVEANHRDIRKLLDEIAPRSTTFFPGHFGPIARAKVSSAFP